METSENSRKKTLMVKDIIILISNLQFPYMVLSKKNASIYDHVNYKFEDMYQITCY